LKNTWLSNLLPNPIGYLSALVFLGLYVVFSPVRILTVVPLVSTAKADSTAPRIAQKLTSAASLALYAGYAQLRVIGACESTGDPNGTPREFNDDGSILWGNDPKTGKPIMRDEGELQINTWVWGKLAVAMGDDLGTETGNVAFGKYLYDKYGAAPWYPSEKCWSSHS
jgi:hypothetical protein